MLRFEPKYLSILFCSDPNRSSPCWASSMLLWDVLEGHCQKQCLVLVFWTAVWSDPSLVLRIKPGMRLWLLCCPHRVIKTDLVLPMATAVFLGRTKSAVKSGPPPFLCYVLLWKSNPRRNPARPSSAWFWQDPTEDRPVEKTSAWAKIGPVRSSLCWGSGGGSGGVRV